MTFARISDTQDETRAQIYTRVNVCTCIKEGQQLTAEITNYILAHIRTHIYRQKHCGAHVPHWRTNYWFIYCK